MEKKLLEVGDIVYDYGQWSGLYRHTVSRVTPKQATAGSLTLRREIIEDRSFGEVKYTAKKIGSYGRVYLETDKLKEEYAETQSILKLKRLHSDLKLNSITKDQRHKLISLYEAIDLENKMP